MSLPRDQKVLVGQVFSSLPWEGGFLDQFLPRARLCLAVNFLSKLSAAESKWFPTQEMGVILKGQP